MESVNNRVTEATNTTRAAELGSNTRASQHPVPENPPHLSENQGTSDKTITHIEGGESPSLKELRKIVREMYPKLYVGHESMDRSLFEELKKHSHPSMQDKHCDALRPLAEGLKDFIEFVENRDGRGKEHFGAQLTKEINKAIKDNKVTYKWLDNSLMRYLAFISADYMLGLDAKVLEAFPKHVVDYIKAKGWEQSGEVAVFENIPLEEKYSSDLQKRVLKYILQHSLVPRVTKYPCFNKSVLGVGTIVEAMVEGIGPKGAPSTVNDVHAFPAPPYYFAIHDDGHAENTFSASDILIHFDGVEDTFSDEQLAKIVDGLLDRYHAFMRLYKDIYSAILSVYENKKLFPQLMAGFFMERHEGASTSKEALGSRDLASAFENIFRSTKNIATGLGYVDDVLKTSPIDGTSTLSDEEMKKVLTHERLKEEIKPANERHIVQRLLTPEHAPNLYAQNAETGEYKDSDLFIEIKELYNSENPEDQAKAITLLPRNIQEALDNIQISKAGENIYIGEVKLDGRVVTTLRQPTLYDVYKNLIDIIGLLSDAGIEIEKPHLDPEDIEGSRQRVLTAIQEAIKAIGNVVDTTRDFIQNTVLKGEAAERYHKVFDATAEAVAPVMLF